jgi:glycosyltransferase involved in cell wall biosynthesis
LIGTGAPRARRRALLVTHVFPPQVAGGAPRVGQFARLLPEFGWDVTVLTAQHHAQSAIDRETEQAIASRARVISAPSPASGLVKRGQSVVTHGIAGLARRVARTVATSVVFPDREVFWVPGAFKVARDELRETHHDVVIATHGPASNLLLGAALARAFRIPLVIDFRDLWSSLPMPVFPTPLHRLAASKIEHAIVRKASRILAVAPAMAEDLAKTHGIPSEHAISITNGFDPAALSLVRDTRPPGARPFCLMYTGTVHVHYNLDPFWRALRSLADRGLITPETFKVEFVGNLAPSGPHEYRLDELVEIRPYVPHEKVFEALGRADAMLVVETPGYYARCGYAAKVFDYVLTGKPVLGLVERGGNTERLLRTMGVGYCVEPSDAHGLEGAILEVMKRQGAAPQRVDAHTPPLGDFNRRSLVGKLAEVLDEVADSEPGGRW